MISYHKIAGVASFGSQRRPSASSGALTGLTFAPGNFPCLWKPWTLVKCLPDRIINIILIQMTRYNTYLPVDVSGFH